MSTDDPAGGQPASDSDTTDPGGTAIEIPDLPQGSTIHPDVGTVVDEGTNSPTPFPIRCNLGTICLYQNIDFNDLQGGCVAPFGPGQKRDLKNVPCPRKNGSSTPFNNQMSSWANLSNRRYCWWTDPGQKGNKHTMNPGTARANVGSDANDRASSVGPC